MMTSSDLSMDIGFDFPVLVDDQVAVSLTTPTDNRRARRELITDTADR